MPANPTERAPPRLSPPELSALMGPSPIIDGDDGAAHEGLERVIPPLTLREAAQVIEDAQFSKLPAPEAAE